MTTAKTQSQELRAASPTAAFSHTPATYPDDGVQSRSAAFPTLQVVGGRGSWDPYGRPQSTEVQAFLGFPANQLLLLAAPSAGAAPVRRLSEYSKIRANKAIEKYEENSFPKNSLPLDKTGTGGAAIP